jgi:hypothetical protein
LASIGIIFEVFFLNSVYFSLKLNLGAASVPSAGLVILINNNLSF